VSASTSRPRLQVDGLKYTARRVSVLLLLGLLPLVFTGVVLIGTYLSGRGAWGIDFNGNFRYPAEDILRGVSPYDLPYLARVHEVVAAGGRPDAFSKGVFVSYPAPSLFIGIPFTYLPAAVAEWLWVALMIGCAALALRLVGVRDWRVYGITLLTPTISAALNYGTVECGLMLALAAAWRWRDHLWRGGLAMGALIALKLLFLPLLAWLLFTRRFACAALACASAVVICLVGWALIGFDGLADYPHLLSLLTSIEKTQGYSSIALAHSAGLSVGAASAVPYALAACTIAALWIAIRRGGPQADANAFMLANLAVMVFSPIVWQHYLALMLVPLAVLRPRFGLVWLVPCLPWLTPLAAYQDATTFNRIVFAAAVLGTAVFAINPRALALPLQITRRRSREPIRIR
jgi:hypothetical protein